MVWRSVPHLTLPGAGEPAARVVVVQAEGGDNVRPKALSELRLVHAYAELRRHAAVLAVPDFDLAVDAGAFDSNRLDVVVVGGGGHLFGGGHTNGVGDSLSKRTGGALNSGGVVLGRREFRVTRGHGVVLTEVLDFFHGKVESGKVQPGVTEHGSVSGRKDESVTVDPGRVSSVVLHLGSVKGSSNFGGSKRKTHVSRVGGGNGVHGKSTGFIGGGGKSGLGVGIDSSALQESGL